MITQATLDQLLAPYHGAPAPHTGLGTYALVVKS